MRFFPSAVTPSNFGSACSQFFPPRFFLPFLPKDIKHLERIDTFGISLGPFASQGAPNAQPLDHGSSGMNILL